MVSFGIPILHEIVVALIHLDVFSNPDRYPVMDGAGFQWQEISIFLYHARALESGVRVVPATAFANSKPGIRARHSNKLITMYFRIFINSICGL